MKEFIIKEAGINEAEFATQICVEMKQARRLEEPALLAGLLSIFEPR